MHAPIRLPAALKAKAARGKTIKVADLFCGAGSLSMGINDALGDLGCAGDFTAVNHWDIATQTYALNHPGAKVHCVTLDAAFPSYLVPGGRLDLLAAGIECTYFSRARGGKPVTDQQRMSAWHVVRWCTELRVKRLLLENVPEFVDWGPVDPRNGKPIKSRKGEYFRAWIAALQAIGFRLDLRVINCADYGDPTTRKRLFILGAADRAPISWTPATHGVAGAGDVARWRPTSECIDWSIRGASIFDRKRPLAPKTLARIAAGLVKFKWPEPFLVVLRQHCDARSIHLPVPTLAAAGKHVALVEPFLATVAHGNQARERDPDTRRCRSLGEPLQTIHAGGGKFGVVEPFILSQASGGAPRGAKAPIPTIPTEGAHALIAPYYGSGSGETCSSAAEPLPTATGKARFGLVMPVTHGEDRSNRARDVYVDPFSTLTTAKRGELALIVPAKTYGSGLGRARSTKEPLPTIKTSKRGEFGVAEGVASSAREYDILFRMLEPHELAAAMSISTAENPYKFVGNKTQVVRQIGQAVPRRTARALARGLIADMIGGRA